MCKKIKKTGCNVLLVQKSILRDAVNELSLHFLSKLKIMVISNIERDDIDFIARVVLFLSCSSRLSAADLSRTSTALPRRSWAMRSWWRRWRWRGEK